MKDQIKDTDYLFISARIRAMEGRLLTRERMERMLEARTDADAMKVLVECGFPEITSLSALDSALSAERERTFADLAALSPNPSIVDAFRIQYDYHNAKTLLKAIATGTNGDHMLIRAGRVPTDTLSEAITEGSFGRLPNTFARAVSEAQSVLGATGDPQRSDFVLDRAYYQEMLEAAKASKSSFLLDYVRNSIDCANLRAAVRAARMGKDVDFLRPVLVSGGNVSTTAFAGAFQSGGEFASLFAGSILKPAAELGDAAVRGGRMTAFEKACDDALVEYLHRARLTPFGDSVLIAYIAAKENEITAARIIMSGRMAGVPADSIRERLREAYV
jgi:V/A-type H+-transporting ATPase subunit C